MLLNMARGDWSLTAPEFTRMYYQVVSAVPAISLVYTALCALAVWSYLYSARSVGMMHTLPIRREGIFLTNFLSGFSMALIPYAVTGAVAAGLAFLVLGFTESVWVAAPVGVLALAATTVAAHRWWPGEAPGIS